MEGVRAGRCHTEKLRVFYHRTAAGRVARDRVDGGPQGSVVPDALGSVA